jgi:hypothetical protein
MTSKKFTRLLAAFTTLTGLIVSVAIAYGFARLRTYAPNDAMFRTARAAESVFILGSAKEAATAMDELQEEFRALHKTLPRWQGAADPGTH